MSLYVPSSSASDPVVPRTLGELLDPGRWTTHVVVTLVVGTIVGSALAGARIAPVWGAALVGLAVAAIPWGLKWRDDAVRYGAGAATLSAMIVLQGLHSIEHVVQVVQLYLLDLPAGRALGVISSANVEWVHLTWNLLVLAGVAFVMHHGLRTPWAWILLAWACAHTFEHAYLYVQHLRVVAKAQELGLSPLSVVQALPGVLGRDGWLASQSWCGRIAGVTTAPRAVIHFVWNAGEMALLLVAARRGWPSPSILAPSAGRTFRSDVTRS